MVRRPRQLAQDYYNGFLAPGEDVTTARTAIAGGTGTLIGKAALVGVAFGWLYAISLDAPLLPSLILGALLGVIVGYALAERAARRSNGPGAVHLVVVKTTERLLTVRRYPILRHKTLRSYALTTISSSTAKPLPGGVYQYLRLDMSDESSLALIVQGALDLNPVNTGMNSG